jgi:Fe-S cluster assembly iron-binding protein IscA
MEKPVMVSLTPSAEQRLEELLVASHAAREHGIRLSPNGRGGITMAVDAPQAGDTVINLYASRLLIVDSRVADALDGKVLDYLAVAADGHDVGRFTIVH